MRAHLIQIGRIYAFHPNGNRRAREIVRVIGNNTQYSRVKGPRKTDVPYNFAHADDIKHAKLHEVQAFVEKMP